MIPRGIVGDTPANKKPSFGSRLESAHEAPLPSVIRSSAERRVLVPSAPVIGACSLVALDKKAATGRAQLAISSGLDVYSASSTPPLPPPFYGHETVSSPVDGLTCPLIGSGLDAPAVNPRYLITPRPLEHGSHPTTAVLPKIKAGVAPLACRKWHVVGSLSTKSTEPLVVLRASEHLIDLGAMPSRTLRFAIAVVKIVVEMGGRVR